MVNVRMNSRTYCFGPVTSRQSSSGLWKTDALYAESDQFTINGCCIIAAEICLPGFASEVILKATVGGRNPYKRAKTLRLASRNNSTDHTATVNSVRHWLLVFASLIALSDREMADRRQ